MIIITNLLLTNVCLPGLLLQVDLALDVEKALPRKLRQKLVTTFEAIQPNKLQGLKAYFNKPAISPMDLQAALKPDRVRFCQNDN